MLRPTLATPLPGSLVASQSRYPGHTCPPLTAVSLPLCPGAAAVHTHGSRLVESSSAASRSSTGEGCGSPCRIPSTVQLKKQQSEAMEEERGPLKGKGPGKQPAGAAALRGKAKPARGRKAASARKAPPALEEEEELRKEAPGGARSEPQASVCLECHITFSDPKGQERHLKKRHPAEYELHVLGGSLFTCYVCDRAFPSSRELLTHQRGHTEERPFQCPVCGARFGRSSELTAHKRTHFGQLGYACAECGKPCKTLTLLKYHRRTHTGERPYLCPQCGKSFSQSSFMQRHLRSHAEEQGAGGESGKGKPQKRKRKRKKGGEKEEEERAIPTASLEAQCFQCSQCLLAFPDPQTAEQHVKSQHPEVAHPPGSPQHSQGSLPPCGEQGHCVGLESGGGEEGEMQAAVTDDSQPSCSSTVCPLQRQPCDLCLNHEPPSHCSPDSLTEPDTPLPLALDLAPSRETSRRFFCQVCGERFYQEPSLQQHQLSNQHWTEPGQNQGGGAASGGEGGPLSELSLQDCLEESLGGNRASGGADGSGFEGRGVEIEEGWGGEDRPHGPGEAMVERGPQLGSAEEGGGGGRLQGVRSQGAELRESGGGASELGARGEAKRERVKQELDLGVKEEGGGDQQPVYCEILPASEPSCLGSGEPEEGAAEVKKEETPELGEGCFYLGTPELRFFHLPDLQEQHGSMAGVEWGATGSGTGFGRRHRPGRGARGEGEGEGVALVVLRQDESDSALGRLRREREPPRIKEEEEEEEGVFFSLSSVLEHGCENQPRSLRGSPTRTLDPEPGAPSPGRLIEVEEGRADEPTTTGPS
ncbi:zinc finger protein 668-like [Polyodon spathula]|uniref:zinc finger protein 668-like n=1 Tax=Polyodon spathula TaxID=7913 RepID=UPI001B7E5A3B|nr:zinc finger protein 668-like [Polyodon spathula]